MKQNIFAVTLFIAACVLSVYSKCSKINPSGSIDTTPDTIGIQAWITKGDRSVLLQKQTALFPFNSSANSYPSIEMDSNQTFQTVDGFGYSLTGGSSYLINKLNATEKNALLQELFGNAENSIRISYLRISIGASDLDASVFSYDDLPAGQTDVSLSQFSLSNDTVDLVPLLKQILAINPNIKIMGSPWSPPVWMKDNGNSKGGSLLTQYYPVYAQYFIKYIQAMKANGITIHAITPQNEPLHLGNNPSMMMLAAQQKDFIKNNLGPAFQAAGITTKIIVYDHNTDRTDYPVEILNDPAAKAFVDGSAFHLYAGDIAALTSVHNMHPDKNIYFTEQWTGANSSFDGDLKWHVKNIIIGSMRNWSKIALEWNLANDGAYNPHTPGGCTECKGALTLDGAINRNVSYYIIAHASKFVVPGSIRIGSTIAGNLHNVAFITPAGKKVLIVMNEANTETHFNISFNGKKAAAKLPSAAVGTFVW